MVRILSKRLRKLRSAGIQGPARERQLHSWFQSSLGKRLAAEQSECAQSVMKSKFGQHLVQLDSGLYLPLVPEAPVGCISLLTLRSNRTPSVLIQAEPEHLPFAPDSVDHIILHHTLDFCDDPYQVLRQSQQHLCQGGYLIIIGFNPYSFWGLRKVFTFRRKRVPWNGRFLSSGRVEDWLSLLDLQVKQHYSLTHFLPINQPVWAQRFNWLAKLLRGVLPSIGGSYMLVAKKEVAGMTMLGKKWRHLNPGAAVSRANIRNGNFKE